MAGKRVGRGGGGVERRERKFIKFLGFVFVVCVCWMGDEEG